MSRVQAREAHRIGLQAELELALLPTKTEFDREARRVRAANISRTLAATR